MGSWGIGCAGFVDVAVASVWDWGRLEYDYYDVPGKAQDIGGWRPLTGLGIRKAQRGSSSSVGVSLDSVLPVLPSRSRLMGRGTQARGAVMVKPEKGAAFAGLGDSWQAPDQAWIVPLIAGGLVAFLATRLVPDEKVPGAVAGFVVGFASGLSAGSATRSSSE